VRVRDASAAHTDRDRVSTGLARVGLPGRLVLIACVTAIVPISCCWVIVIVRSRPVVVIWVIVPDVFVDVQRRRHGRRHDQGLSKQECDEPAHGSSVLRPAGMLRKTGRVRPYFNNDKPDHACHNCQGQVRKDAASSFKTRASVAG
jgi:hypothetical protein